MYFTLQCIATHICISWYSALRHIYILALRCISHYSALRTHNISHYSALRTHNISCYSALRTHSSEEGLTDIVKELDKLLEEVKKLKDSKTKQVEYTEENTQDITCDIETLLREPTEDLDLVKLQTKFDEVLGQIEI